MKIYTNFIVKTKEIPLAKCFLICYYKQVVWRWVQKKNRRDVAQFGSASGLGPEGRRFESCHPDQTKPDGSLAQLGEHLPYKQRVTGSSPVTPTIKIHMLV